MTAPTRGRRATLALFLAAAVVSPAAACGGEEADEARAPKQPQFQRFQTRPKLRPPVLVVTRVEKDSIAPGYLFLSPKKEGASGGPLIVDAAGKVVWFRPVHPRLSADFRVQRYRGQPVLTWWEGKQTTIGVGAGKFVIMDTSYRPVADVRTGNGLEGDLHEFLITPRDTALVLAYTKVQRNLTALGGPKRGWVYDNVVQEIDIATGRVLFEWRSLDHVGLTESASKPLHGKASKDGPFDYFHVNSIEEDTDGDLIISARNTHAIYKIRRRSGKIAWTLGGKNSDFELGPGTRFAWQHDARRLPDGTLMLFDNSAEPKVADESRAIVLRLDEAAMTATLVRAYEHPERLLAPHQGNAQLLPNGNVLVGWGGKPYVTEFSPDGDVLFDARLAAGDSYRAYRLPWSGRPTNRPAVAARAGEGDRVTVFASWNGATDVARWEVLAGPNPGTLGVIRESGRHGFETAIRVATREAYVAVRALDRDGHELRVSPALRVARG